MHLEGLRPRVGLGLVGWFRVGLRRYRQCRIFVWGLFLRYIDLKVLWHVANIYRLHANPLHPTELQYKESAPWGLRLKDGQSGPGRPQWTRSAKVNLSGKSGPGRPRCSGADSAPGRPKWTWSTKVELIGQSGLDRLKWTRSTKVDLTDKI